MQLIHGLHFNNIRGDIFGGVVAAIVALPLALAFGVASGAGAIAGLYGAIFVGFFAALFGGTPAQCSGPTGPMTVVMAGILLVVIGYGMYQPGAYAAVRQFTTPKTAAMGFAMLYALMNLGGWIPTAAFALRNNDFEIFSWSVTGAGLGRLGTIWVYTGCTAAALLATWLILSRRTVAKAIAEAKAEREVIEAESNAKAGEGAKPEKEEQKARETSSAAEGAAAQCSHLYGGS